MKSLAKIKNPIQGMLLWILFVGVLTILLMILTGINSSGGAQIPMFIFAYSIYIVIGGLILICILTPILFSRWFAKYWIIILAILLALSYLLYHAFNK